MMREYSSGPVVGVPFEHHVLEKMRQTALAVFFIASADAIPDLKSDRRTLVVLQQENFETVIENELLNLSGVCSGSMDSQ